MKDWVAVKRQEGDKKSVFLSFRDVKIRNENIRIVITMAMTRKKESSCKTHGRRSGETSIVSGNEQG